MEKVIRWQIKPHKKNLTWLEILSYGGVFKSYKLCLEFGLKKSNARKFVVESIEGHDMGDSIFMHGKILSSDIHTRSVLEKCAQCFEN